MSWTGSKLNPATTVILADPHPLTRAALRSLLGDKFGCDVIVTSSLMRTMLQPAELARNSLLVADFAALGRHLTLPPLLSLTAVLAIESAASRPHLSQLNEAGCRGIFLKTDPIEEIADAVTALLAGQTRRSQAVETVLNAPHPLACLTARERDVFYVAVAGKSNREIAAGLAISVKTVDHHRGNIMRKIGVHSVVQLILWALENEVLPR